MNSSVFNVLYGPNLLFIHDYWKNHTFGYSDFFEESNVSAFNMLSRFIIAILPRIKGLLISWLLSPSTLALELKKTKPHSFHFLLIYLSWSDGTGCHDLSFWMLYSSVQFSHSVVSDSLRPHELQHARPPCPSPTPGVHSNSHPLSQWCHPAISSSVVPFSSWPQFPPASESFPMSQPFTWGGQSTGVSASASFLPKNTHDQSPLEWTGWISLQSKGLARVFSSTAVQNHQFFGTQLSSQSNFHIHTWLLEKP